MWPFKQRLRPQSLARSHVARSRGRIYETSVESLHDWSRFQESFERNARVSALREELHTIAFQDASTLPPAPIAPDAALPCSANTSPIELPLPASAAADVTSRGGTYAAVFGSGPHTRIAARSVSDERRFGIYLPSATASENNLLLHRLGASTLHVLQERPASLTPTSSSAIATASAAREQRTRQPRRHTHRSENLINDDPPPEYVPFDPHPFIDAQPKPRRRSTIEIIETFCKDGFRATTGKVGKSVVKHVEDVGKMAKDVPIALKEAQIKLNSKRAKDKIRWLERHNYLNGQERVLARELVG